MMLMEQEPIMVEESERPALRKIEGVLDDGRRIPKLVGPYGEEIELPTSLFHVLRSIVRHLLLGRVVTVTSLSLSAELTTQEAADILNVSRPYLVKLLGQRAIPFVKVGTHRRIQLDDLIKYKKVRDAERKRGLDELAQMSQDLGLYDE